MAEAQDFALLLVGFTLAPLLFGLDKFAHWMVDCSTYLWSGFASLVPGTSQMLLVGVIEIVAGVLVAVRPRLGRRS